MSGRRANPWVAIAAVGGLTAFGSVYVSSGGDGMFAMLLAVILGTVAGVAGRDLLEFLFRRRDE